MSVIGLLEISIGVGLSIGPAIGAALYDVSHAGKVSAAPAHEFLNFPYFLQLGGFVLPFFTLGGFMMLLVPFSMYFLEPPVSGNIFVYYMFPIYRRS